MNEVTATAATVTVTMNVGMNGTTHHDVESELQSATKLQRLVAGVAHCNPTTRKAAKRRATASALQSHCDRTATALRGADAVDRERNDGSIHTSKRCGAGP